MTSLSGMVGVRKERKRREEEEKREKRKAKSQPRRGRGAHTPTRPHAQSERPWRRSTFGSQILQLCALDYVDGWPLAQGSFTARNAQCISVSFVIFALCALAVEISESQNHGRLEEATPCGSTITMANAYQHSIEVVSGP